MPQPSKQIHVCAGCGAVGTGQGFPLDNRCLCIPDGPRPPRLPVVVAPLDISYVDPIAKITNEYARRVRQRLAADCAYLLLAAEQGHALAAEQTCTTYGHDARAGLCMRCGARLGRAYEED